MKRILLFLFYLHLTSLAPAQKIYTACGTGAGNSGGDGGPAIAAQLKAAAVSLDNAGNLYIVDFWNSYVRKVNTSGIISTIAGTGSNGSSGDGGPAVLAQLNAPQGITVDALGNIYISEIIGNCIRKINTAGIISTIAGTGSGSYTGDGGPATSATLNNPLGLTTDATGNLYICDYVNHCIRKIDASGIITTIAGTGTAGFSGDGGPATFAKLNFPSGITVDAANNMYITDTWNQRIRKVNSSGIITTIAGNGTAGFSGEGGPAASAMLNYPRSITIDGSGNIFITDNINHRLRKIGSSGIITTIAGTGTSGFSGDGGLATLAEINTPNGIVLDASGNIYFCVANNRVREICYTSCLAGIEDLFNRDFYSIYPQPAKDIVNISLNYFYEPTIKIRITDVTGKVVRSSELVVRSGKAHIETAEFSNGVYILQIISKDQIAQKRFVIAK